MVVSLNSLPPQEAERIMKELSHDGANLGAFGVAKQFKATEAGEAIQKGNRALTYGEIDFDGFTSVLNAIPLPTRTEADVRFVDLGSGTGKAVILAALSGTFSHCLGVEIIPGLHDIAQRRLDKHAEADCKPAKETPSVPVVNALTTSAHSPCEVQLICASIIDPEAIKVWTQSHIAFACSLEFGPVLQSAVTLAARNMNPGTYLITMHQLEAEDCEYLELISKEYRTVSWSWAQFFTYKRNDKRINEQTGSPLPSMFVPDFDAKHQVVVDKNTEIHQRQDHQQEYEHITVSTQEASARQTATATVVDMLLLD